MALVALIDCILFYYDSKSNVKKNNGKKVVCEVEDIGDKDGKSGNKKDKNLVMVNEDTQIKNISLEEDENGDI